MSPLHVSLVALCAVLMLAFTPGRAEAQSRPPTVAAGQSTAGTSLGASSRRPAPAPLTPVQRAGVVHQRAEALSRRLATQLDEARRDSDRLRTRCLSDLLSQANALVRIIEQQVVSLRLAVDLSDTQRMNHAVTVLRVQEARIDELTARSRTCLGDTGSFAAGTRVIVIIDPSVPRGDPTLRPPEPRDFPWVPPP